MFMYFLLSFFHLFDIFMFLFSDNTLFLSFVNSKEKNLSLHEITQFTCGEERWGLRRGRGTKIRVV